MLDSTLFFSPSGAVVSRRAKKTGYLTKKSNFAIFVRPSIRPPIPQFRKSKINRAAWNSKTSSAVTGKAIDSSAIFRRGFNMVIQADGTDGGISRLSYTCSLQAWMTEHSPEIESATPRYSVSETEVQTGLGHLHRAVRATAVESLRPPVQIVSIPLNRTAT